MFLLLALLIGVISGLRAMTAPAAVAWGAALGWFEVSQTPLAFMGYRWTPWIFTVLAIVELITDQLPSTPSRKVPVQFRRPYRHRGARRGDDRRPPAACSSGGLIAGVIGAVIGTYGGAALRGRVAASFGRDLPAALIEDAVAVIGAALIVGAVS